MDDNSKYNNQNRNYILKDVYGKKIKYPEDMDDSSFSPSSQEVVDSIRNQLNKSPFEKLIQLFKKKEDENGK